MQDNISKLYSALKDTYELGSEDDFRRYLSDGNKREALRKELEDEWEVGDSAAFSRYLGFNDKEGSYNGDFTMSESELEGKPSGEQRGTTSKPQQPQQPREQSQPQRIGNIPTVADVMDNRPTYQPKPVFETEVVTDEEGNRVRRPKLQPTFAAGRMQEVPVVRDVMGNEYDPTDESVQEEVRRQTKAIPRTDEEERAQWQMEKDKTNDPSLMQTIGKSIGAGFTRVGAGLIDVLQQLSSNLYVEDASSPTGYTRTQSYEEQLNDKNNPLTQASASLNATAERMSKEAQPYGGQKGFIDLLLDGELGKFVQKGIATAGESLPMTLSWANPYTATLNAISMAGGNYRQETLENPDIPAWKRASYAIGSAAIEQAVEKYADPVFKYIGKGESKEIAQEVTKEATENIAKRIFNALGRLGKDAAGEGGEEVITNFGNDALGQMLDLANGDKNYGIEAQWQKIKKENPDADLWNFAMAKAKENVESFIGGALAGAYTSGTAQVTAKALEYATKSVVEDGEPIEPVTLDVAQSFDNGYTLEGQEKNDAKNNLDYQWQRIEEIANDEMLRQLDEEPIESLAFIATNEDWSEEEKQIAIDYVNAKATYDGMLQKVTDDIDGRIAESDGIIGERVSKTDGMIHPAILKAENKQVYIVDGNVQMLPDGTMVDVENSDGSIIVRDAETGELSFVTPSDFMSVDEAIDAEEEAEAARNTIREQVAQQAADEIEGVLPFNDGDQYTVLDDEGQQHTIEVVPNPDADASGAVAEGSVLVSVDGAYVPQVMSREEIQRMFEANNLARLAENEKEKEAKRAEEAAMQSQQTEQTEGAQQTEEGGAGGEASPEQTGANEPSAATADNAMPMIGEGEDAEPDFMAVTPERAHSYLYNEAGLSRDEANQFVEANKKAADKELEKAKKGKPTMGTSLARYKREQSEYQQKVDAAQQVADYWQQVKDAQQLVLASELDARAAEDAANIAQAKQEEQLRQEEKLLKKAEQAALGTNNVAPAIREKWDAAPKVEGARNEIVLANGERVPGKYVLVESGAATPSHNPRAEFSKNEGYPVDENGQSVNDRDYERDKDAQTITRQIADNYDQRAAQSPIVVSKDGIVMSGNGRTMAGELAAAHNTDGAYIDYLTNYGSQYGFTSEQVGSMAHPRVVFVPDADMPYNAETYAKFNQQEMKGQSKTEQAVKLGKIVDDNTFGRIIRSINGYNTLGEYYADTQATTQAINELRDAGAISQAQYGEMFDGETISAQGREMLENMLIGKAFESNPDAVRQITAFKGVRQGIITALAEISNNLMLGDEYSHEADLAQAINLVYQARNAGYKAGEKVSSFARQLNLFPFDEGATVVDADNATVLMLADLLNEGKPTLLKKALALYNQAAKDSANGQLDIFSGDVRSKEEILDEVRQLLKYGTEEQQQAALDAATAERVAASQPIVQEDGTTGTSNQDGETAGSTGVEAESPVAAAEREVNTNPTEAQKEAGNYKKGHVKIDGYDVTIENPKGSERSGTDASGKQWRQTIHNTYGYIRGTEGVDGDHIDVFLSDAPESGNVYVIDQRKADGSFDEHKVMYGFNSAEEARDAYLSNYEEGWQGLGIITEVSKDEFKKWIDSSHRKTKPFAEYKSVKPIGAQNEGTAEPHPIGVGSFGNIYDQFRGKAKEAIDFLQRKKSGEAIGALHHKDIGDIDLVWGEEGTGKSDGYGLAKLVKYHPDVLDNLQEILDDMHVTTRSENRVNLESDTHQAAVRLTWDNQKKTWLLTAFEKKNSALGNTTDTGETSSGGKRNDTATPRSTVSEGKGTEKSDTKQEKGEKTLPKSEKKEGENAEANASETVAGGETAIDKQAQEFMDAYKKWGEDVHDDASYKAYKDAQNRLHEQMRAMSDDELAAFNEKYGKQYGAIADEVRKEQGRRLNEARINKSFEDGLQAQGEITGTAKAPKVATDSFTANDETRQVLNGVYHDKSGYAVATDGSLLVADKSQYDEGNKGKIVASHKVGSYKKGDVIPGNYPKWRMVVDGMEGSNTASVAWDGLRNFLAGAEEQLKARWKAEKESNGTKQSFASWSEPAIVAVRMPNGKICVYNYGMLRAFSDAAASMGMSEITYGAEKPLKATNDNGVVMLMPVNPTAIAEEEFGHENEGRRLYYEWGGAEKAQTSKPAADAAGTVAKPAEEAAARRTRASKVGKIDDFGEKIGGARKDVARGRIRDTKKMTVKDLTTLKKGADDILSQANIMRLYKDGQMDEQTARGFMALNNAAKVAMKHASPTGRELIMTKYRDAAVAWEEGKPVVFEVTDEDVRAYQSQFGVQVTDEKARESLDYLITDPYNMFMQTYEAIDYPAVERKLGQYVIVDYTSMNGRHYVPSRPYWVKNGLRAQRGYPFGTMESAVSELKKLCPEVTEKEKKARGEKAEHGLHVTKEGYGFYIKSRNIPGNIYLSPKFFTEKEAQKYLDDNLERLKEREQRLVDALMGSNIGMAEREGVDYRNGKDVTPQDFLDEFGFRGVEFGNWVPQGERQMYLNKTYDAIKDFCAIVGISPRAFSLGGRLGLAFGARGKSRAMAHYEPGKEVINLTRMSGVGSLAHEWFHALDNYLAKQKTGNMSDMATETHDVVREELGDVFKEMFRAMRALDYDKRSRRAGEYWGRTVEEFARLFENYIYNKLAAKETTSPVLVREDVLLDNIGEDLKNSWPYPSAEENAKMEPYFDKLFDTIQEKTDANGNVVLFQKVDGSTIAREADAAEEALRDEVIRLMREAGIEVSTDWEEGQRVLDEANGRASLMAARKNIESGIEALQRIADGEERVPNAMTRDDLSRFGGDNNITFYYGSTGDAERNFKGGYGIAHIGGKHGAETLLHVLNVIATGKIDRYVNGNRTVVLSDGEYEVVLALTRFGNKETWLFNGWKKDEKTGADGEVSTHSDATQANPTFSREDLGAVLSDAKLRKEIEKAKQNDEKLREMRFFRTSNGEAYGFTLNGKIYLDPHIATSETPIHEYAHLWAQALRQANPEAWEKLKDEMRKEQDVMDYVKRLYPEITDEDELLEEVFTHYSGKRGAERLRNEMREEMAKANGIIDKARVATVFAKLRDMLSRFWNMARDLFAGKNENLANMKGEDFADMMMNDLMGGFRPAADATGTVAARDMEYAEADEAERMFNELNERYNGKPVQFIRLDNVGDEDFFRAIGATEEDIAEMSVEEMHEQAEKLKKLFKSRHSIGGYSRLNRKITIFADRIEPNQVEEVFFHENIHGILHDWYEEEPRGIAEHFFDAAPKDGGFKDWTFIEKGYEGKELKQKKEEFFVYWLSKAMVEGRTQEILDMLDWEDSERIENILKSIGYERGREEAERRKGEEDSEDSEETHGQFLPSLSGGRRNGQSTIGYEREAEDRRRAEESERRAEENKAQEDTSPVLGRNVPGLLLEREGQHGMSHNESLASSRAAGYTKKQHEAWWSRRQRGKRNMAEDMAAKMHLGDRVTIVDSADELDGMGFENLTDEDRQSKGWFDTKTGKIVIILGNHASPHDVLQTMLHEGVNHYGLRELFGKNFLQFLDNVYEHATPEIRRKIAELSAKYGFNIRTATEEYLGKLAEETDFENADKQGWWHEIKMLFFDMLHSIGLSSYGGAEISDNELRYILWRSYKNLTEPGSYRNLFDVAADVVMQEKLGVGRFAKPAADAARTVAAEPAGIDLNDVEKIVAEPEADGFVGGVGIHLTMKDGNTYHLFVETDEENGDEEYLGTTEFYGNEDEDIPDEEMTKRFGKFFGEHVNTIFGTRLGELLTSKRTQRNGITLDSKDIAAYVGLQKAAEPATGVQSSYGDEFSFEQKDEILNAYQRAKDRYDAVAIVNTPIGYVVINDDAKLMRNLYGLDRKPYVVVGKEMLDDVMLKLIRKGHKVVISDISESGRLHRPGQKALARDTYERLVASGSEQFAEAVQDSMRSLKNLYKAITDAEGNKKHIRDVAGYENAYLAENRMHSASQAQISAWEHDFINPIVQEVYDLAGDDAEAYDALIDYMMAKHGLERNRVLAERDAQAEAAAGNGDYNDLLSQFREKDYAGLTALTGEADVAAAEAAAQQMVDDYEASHYTAELWKKVNAATKSSLEKLFRSGMMSKERYEKIRDMFEYYIPLQGFDETVAEDVYAYMGSDGTRLYGTPIRTAKGRKSKADDPLATIQMNGEAAIRQGNRNEMKQTFLNFVQNHPSDLVSVSDVWLRYNDVTDEWEQYFDAGLRDGDTAADVARKVEAFEQRMEQLAQSDPDHYKRGSDMKDVPFRVLTSRDMAQHQVMVRRGGKTYVLTINGNPRAAQALNGMTNPDVFEGTSLDLIANALLRINRLLSAFYTTRSPNFVAGNYARDTLYTNCMTWVKESPSYALQFHKNIGMCNPTTMGKLFVEWENGELRKAVEKGSADDMRRQFYDFMMNGGETGWTSLRDIEQHKKALEADIRREGNTSKKAWKAIGGAFDIVNRAVENSARFAAFVTSREMGRSLERSIYDAKEVSVNFNKKGSADKFLTLKGQTKLGKAGGWIGGIGRAGYVFFNAGVQGLSNIAGATKEHPFKAAGLMTALYMLGAIMPIIGEIVSGGGDDDDDYYNLPEYVRRSNIVFRFGKDKPWVKIPLPIEFRAMYGLGELACGVLRGKERYSNEELSKQFISQISQVLPLDFMEGGGGWHAFIPSATKPGVEAYANTSWTGLPIYRDNKFKPYAPEWTLAYDNTDKTLVAMTRWLNEATGGSDVSQGWIDWNPARIEYMLKGYLGGPYTMYDQMKKTAETAFGEREFEWRNIPVASRFLHEGDERTSARKAKSEYFDLLKEYDETKSHLNDFKKIADSRREDAFEYAKRIDFLHNSKEYTHYQIIDNYKPLLDAYHDMEKDAEGEEKKKIQEEEDMLRRECIDLIHAVDDGKEIDTDAYIESSMERMYGSWRSDIRKKAGSIIAKGLGGTDYYGNGSATSTEYGKAYDMMREKSDLEDDVRMQVEVRKAKEGGNKNRESALESSRRAMNDVKKYLSSGADQHQVMEDIRRLRKYALELPEEISDDELEEIKANIKESKDEMIDEYGVE